jgi:predicted phage-related endonuclease
VSEDRRHFIGGSDTAAILGLAPPGWGTALDLYLEKTGQAPERTADDVEREKLFARGKRLEPVIVDMGIQKLRDMGLRVEELSRNMRHTDKEFPFLRCEIDFSLRLWGEAIIDGVEVQFEGERINADAKSVSHFAAAGWGVEHTDEIPPYYAAQFMHGLGITGVRFCLAVALRSLDDVDLFWLQRDEEIIDGMRRQCVDFWSNVQHRTPPPPVNLEDVRTLFPRDDGTGLVADEELADVVDGLRAARANKKHAEDVERELQFRIVEAMGARSALLHPTTRKVLATFKAQSDGRRVLRLPEPRKTAR